MMATDRFPKRLWMLMGALISVCILMHIQGRWHWSYDYWEHLAVVRAFASNLFSPKHPLFFGEYAHAFFTPYHFILGILAQYVSPRVLMALAGSINIALFCHSLHLFLYRLTEKRALSFYTLLLTLFVWIGTWNFSGFFHVKVFFAVSSYPSFFAAIVTFYAWYQCLCVFSDAKRYRYGLLFGLTFFCVLSHPLTYIVFFIGLIALYVSKKGMALEGYKIFLFVLLGFALALFWPFFSLLELFRSGSDLYHQANQAMYHRFWIRAGFAVLCLPLLWKRYKDKKTDFFVLLSVGLLAIYVLGYMTHLFSYGRVVSYFLLMMNCVAASWCLERPRGVLFLLALVAAGVFRVSPFFEDIMPLGQDPNSYFSRLTFLKEFVQEDAVILSDEETSRVIPAINGKVVGSSLGHPVAFIPDFKERNRSLQFFFHKAISPEERRLIMNRYLVDYILVNKQDENLLENPSDAFLRWGDVVYEDATYCLIQL